MTRVWIVITFSIFILTSTLVTGISLASDSGLDSAVDKYLQELGRPWPVDCSLLSQNVDKKRKCVVAAYALAHTDSLRSIGAVDSILKEYRSLDAQTQQLYAPVLSKIASQKVTQKKLAVEVWRESYQLILLATDQEDCEPDLYSKWQRQIRIEGIVILTRAGYSEENPEECAQWLEQAHRLAVLAECPAMAPLSSNELIDYQPEILTWAKPAYSEEARRAGLEGTVVVKVLLNECGEVIQAEIQTGVHKMLDDAALSAGMKCRFSPGRRQGVPVKAYMALPFSFKLNPGH